MLPTESHTGTAHTRRVIDELHEQTPDPLRLE